VASGSKYFLEKFKAYRSLPEEKAKNIDPLKFYAEVPRPITTS
jgi:hypothetical protein